ncbi:putative serine/threonine-protein kinase-like protein CCR3 [Coffea eugenioides]|uniref:putative serine/threonine-protein kinase-like protein CCR3 n=1 Tax=Coffea eugenioides TaxID=49369 RepID=UPI000F60ECC0|nr:putative serine/threonine-protein kinase-like protein CCR3 [Coffea eugenioides]
MNSPAFPSTTITLLIIIILTTCCQHGVTSLGSGSTIAVSYTSGSTNTVCGIIASKLTQRIQCYKNCQTISIQPEISYESISGGLGYFCGLQSGGLSIICWDTMSFRAKRIYYSKDNRLKGLSVGNYQVCALQFTTGAALCWRFPSSEEGTKFRAITSGEGFSCGILKNAGRVHCWGRSEIGAEIEIQFKSLPMLNLIAGESHACGVTKAGTLICKGSNIGGQLNVPSHYAFEFSSLALGANHSCGIRKKNGLVVCWGGGSRKLEFSSNVVDEVSFDNIVAALDFTCGLTTKDLSIICWGPGWSRNLTAGDVVLLEPVLPGPCMQMSCSVCGVYPNSGSLCAGSGSICKVCEVELPIPVNLPPLMPSTPGSQVPELASSPSRTKNSLFLAFGVVGCIGAFAGICTIAYCFCAGLCGNEHKNVYKPVVLQPTSARSNLEDYLAASNASILPPSGSSSIKRNNSWVLRSQRNGTSSRQTERTENFTLSELAAITSNFAQENKIGGGSFGRVYKGKLADGREVAIKRAECSSKTKKFQEKESSFLSEIALLSCLNHKHLVGLVGFCQENDERLLVYEYMRNGSLHDHLHGQRNRDSSMLNSWRMRIRIALDAARGIEYLHTYSIPPIIHRDIKSSNIHLDGNWTARVSDFGLSLMWPESEDEPMYMKAVGTVGYIDPECYVLNILTVKSDVYGFGVVLLELLTGKKAVFTNEGAGPMGVVEYARPWIVAGELEKILDKRVGLPEMNEIEAVEVVACTALHCISLQGKDRPTVSDVVAKLERALALCDDSSAIVIASPA